ncbi:MAG: hypothetical protein MUF84_11695 [Anaerolineae bacterium]|jgi:hypothetical protein|nr:hypothetical protein [Anaerolineae bacterium]
MDDAYLYFTAATGDSLTNSKALSKVLLEDEVTEVGRGHQKFIEVMTDGGFTSGTEVASLHLKTGTTSPGDTKLMEVFSNVAASVLSAETTPAQRLIAKVPLPSEGLSDYISLYFYAETALTAGGKLLARIVLS